MHQTTELTVVLRARDGEYIADLAPFLKAGSTVAIGRGGALVSAVSTGDKITHAERLENQVVLAESAMRRGVQIPAPFDLQHIDDRIRAAAEHVDPRNLFIKSNPIGASADELEKGRNGFVDERTHADYLIFLAGYRAALEVEPCEA
jgi:carbon storage regulator